MSAPLYPPNPERREAEAAGLGRSWSADEPRREQPGDRAARIAARAATHVWRELTERRGLRLGIAGVLIFAFGLHEGTGTALGLTLVVAGLVMVLIGTVGARLRGRISLEFGPGGTSFDLQTHVAPPGRALVAPVPETDIGRARMSLVPEPPEADVVESTGHTVEIDVAQLKALIAEEEARTRHTGA